MIDETKTIESQASDAVQQKPLGTFRIGDDVYTVDRPRVRTIIIVSELISRLPGVNIKVQTSGEQLMEVLRTAKDSEALGEIAAVLILGAKHLTEERTIERRQFFGLKKTVRTIVVDKKKELADKLLLELDSDELSDLILEALSYQKTNRFFALIASLYEVNLLKPTVEATTTASGQ